MGHYIRRRLITAIPVFFGITLAGSAELLGLRRVCFADRYE